MVLLTIMSRFNRVAGPFLLRHGLSLRYKLGRGVIRDNPTLDALLLLPLSQKLVELEIAATASTAADKQQPTSIDQWADTTFDSIFGKDASPNAQQPRGAVDKYIRPVLVPNEKWSDVNVWRFHTRFLKWARAEMLREVHGPALRAAFSKYPKLQRGPQVASKGSASAIRSLLGATNETKGDVSSVTVPTCDMITKAFGMKAWKRSKDSDAVWNQMTKLAKQLDGQIVPIPGTSLRFADIDSETDTTQLSVEDILELAGGHVASCGPLNVLAEECDIYQLWTKEYIQGLAEYLLSRQGKKSLVLDVGAGDGLLARLLREHFHDAANNAPDVVAVDDGSWKISPKTDVEKISYDAAIQKYASADYDKVIVVCSWMPMGQDWTAAFRKQGIVDEYILIGESDDGNCGCNWDTWGNPIFGDGFDDTSFYTPSFEVDGYKRVNLASLEPFQFSRFDSADSANSMTVCFRKQ